ncbi:Protein of unknown function DUF677 [Macleaya cordata]|uniref:Uncharacterized protein n=1 Tax=Macleaya cordata TaxID=56857 RepID=A0A200PZM4_MACCD|nr:Protein of unknown function DUF677 [Macleaya cordata]OVA03669.1 Protein of unknown function DUF677 [Macleaya cordata]
MGGYLSKKTSEFHPPVQQLVNSESEYRAALSSYEAERKFDRDLQSFHEKLQHRTSQVINRLAGGIEDKVAISLDSLKEAIGSLLEMNDEAFKIILDCKEDISENQGLFELIQEYFENNLQTLNLCTALQRCLRKARKSILIIQVALQQFDEEDGMEKNNKYLKTMEELKIFKTAGEPFTEEVFQILRLVYKNRVVMLEKVQAQKSKLDKKLKSVKAWRKVSSIILITTFAALLICSVVAAAVAAPPVAAAVAAATAIPLGSTRRWFDSLFKKYEDELVGHKEVISSMQVGTCMAIKDLDDIRVRVDRLEEEIKSLFQNVDFALREEEAVKIGLDEIKTKLRVFKKSIEDLSEMVDRCSNGIRLARRVLLDQIINHPNDRRSFMV